MITGELIVELVGVLIWPSILLVALLFLRDPIRSFIGDTSKIEGPGGWSISREKEIKNEIKAIIQEETNSSGKAEKIADRVFEAIDTASITTGESEILLFLREEHPTPVPQRKIEDQFRKKYSCIYWRLEHLCCLGLVKKARSGKRGPYPVFDYSLTNAYLQTSGMEDASSVPRTANNSM
jgi:hypothetical protein